MWLDPKGHYTGFVDALRDAGGWLAPVVAHRGSYLELMVELEHHAGSIDKSPLLVHLPGPIEVKATPMLEVYAASKPLRKAIDTVIREAALGWVAPDELDAFLRAERSLAEADAWLASKLAASAGELLVTLHAMKVGELVAALLDPSSPLLVQLRTGDPAGNLQQLRNHLAGRLGLPEGWGFPEPLLTLDSVGEAAASWALCVEYVHDLGSDPVAAQLQGIKGRLAVAMRDACCAVARALRERVPVDYDLLARNVEAWIDAETRGVEPGKLGKIDTFRFEEEQLLAGALASLVADRWDEAATWARERLEGKSFWVERDAARRSAWNLIAAAAALGQALARSKLDLRRADSLDEATSLYVERGAVVDRRHRELVQQIETQLFDKVPHVEQLRRALEHVRKVHARWQDRVAHEWSVLCEREGALPSRELQQRELFDAVVRPLVERDKTAFFMVDALRFEMATELVELLGFEPSVLRARLAELPTVTEIGMNVLAPIAEAGKLKPLLELGKDGAGRRFKGFAAQQFQVTSPEARKKAMHGRVGGNACPDLWIEDLLRMTADELRRSLRQAKLAIIKSRQIDKSGETGMGPRVFGAELRSIRAAWQLLREAGVNNFVITADHGFLLRERSDATLDHGQGHDASARYALYDAKISSDEQVAIPLRSLHYEGIEGNLLLARSCAAYGPGKDRNFVHGGNSPQERVIPVLTLEHKAPIGASDRRYELALEQVGTLEGMHYIDACLRSAADQKGLAFTDPQSVDFDLRVVDDARVQVHTSAVGKDAQLAGGVVLAKVNATFRLYFRLSGPREARVLVELYHPSGTQMISPLALERRFDVTEARDEPRSQPSDAAPAAEPPAAEPPRKDWLDGYAPNVRKVFAHIAKFGGINQAEITGLLGSPRAFRMFSLEFDELAARAPFVITVDTSTGMVRYTRRGEK